MPTTKTRLKLDTTRLNFRLQHWKPTVLDPLDIFGDIVEQANKDRAAIDNDRNLTNEGKAAARAAKRDAALKAISDVQTPRLAGLDADVAAHRAQLIPTNTLKPSERQVDSILFHLRSLTPVERAALYNSATPDEQLVIEEASRSVGRIPTKRADGSVAWLPLIEPEMVNNNVVARATATNPQGAQKLQELEEIRAMHVSTASLAAAEVKEVLEG